jgi:hypothetical protein
MQIWMTTGHARPEQHLPLFSPQCILSPFGDLFAGQSGLRFCFGQSARSGLLTKLKVNSAMDSYKQAQTGDVH